MPDLIALTLTCLFVITGIATALSLLDSWLRGSNAYTVLKREQALLNAGFLPQVGANEVRLRKPAHRTLAAAKRGQNRRMHLPATSPVTQLAS
ncbi:MAG: hypothetical protein ABJN35_00330 [Erythrobacter sp.]